MTNLIASPQLAEDLVLALLEQDKAPSMRVLLSESLAVGAWRFDFAIIGESHYLRISHAGQLMLLEILACLAIKAEDCRLYQPLRALTPFRCDDGAYRVAIAFESRLPVWTQKQDALRYRFPLTHGKIPETRIQWQLQAGKLSWQTLHTYPKEAAQIVVLSESEFVFD